MQYIIGAGLTLFFFIACFLSFIVGYKINKQKVPHKQEEQDEQVKRKQEQIQKELVEMINYNLGKAIKNGR